MNSNKIVNLLTPTAPADAVSKSYVDTLVGGTSGSGSQNLAQVLVVGNSAGSNQINMNSNKIVNLLDPTSAQDAATKNYVDTHSSSSSGSTSNQQSVTQVNHGFTVGTIIRCASGQQNNTYQKSTTDAEVVGYVTAVASANAFTFQSLDGFVTTGVPTASAGTVMFLDPNTAGAITSTVPSATQINKPIGVVLASGSLMELISYRGLVQGSGSGTGSTGTAGMSTGTPSKLGAVDIDGTTNTINTNKSLYVVPANTYVYNLNLSVTNRNSSTSALVRIAHIVGTLTAVTSADFILYDAIILPNETKDIEIPGAVPSDTFLVRSDTTNVNFVLSGGYGTSVAFNKVGAIDIDGITRLVNTNYSAYQAGASNTVFVHYLICNRSSNTAKVITAQVAGTGVGSVTNADYLLYNASVVGNSSVFEDSTLGFGNSNTLLFSSDTTNVNCIVYGQTIT